MNILLFVESVEHGSALTLKTHDASCFIVEVRSHGLSATTRVGFYMSGGLGKFFGEMAEQWRGWSGERQWSALEGEFALRAHSDRLGHVFLTVCLREGHPSYWKTEVDLTLEAGQLERVAAGARRFDASVS